MRTDGHACAALCAPTCRLTAPRTPHLLKAIAQRRASAHQEAIADELHAKQTAGSTAARSPGGSPGNRATYN
eukprot:7700499-Pyramimonas_sp.AAC.1